MAGEQSRGMGIMNKILRIDRGHKATIEAQMSRLGIHRSQLQVLIYLYFHSEAPTQDQIAKTMEISPAAIAVTLKKLEAAGLVERTVRMKNGREKEVHLTDEGKKAVKVSFEIFNAVDDVLTNGFSDDELAIFEDFLDRMSDNLKCSSPNLSRTCCTRSEKENEG